MVGHTTMVVTRRGRRRCYCCCALLLLLMTLLLLLSLAFVESFTVHQTTGMSITTTFKSTFTTTAATTSRTTSTTGRATATTQLFGKKAKRKGGGGGGGGSRQQQPPQEKANVAEQRFDAQTRQFMFTLSRLTKILPDKSKTILDNINLSFYPGAKIGVVGLNGSGYVYVI